MKTTKLVLGLMLGFTLAVVATGDNSQQTAKQHLDCSVTVTVYDPVGEPLDFSIVKVIPVSTDEDLESLDLLKLEGATGLAADGNVLRFPKRAIGGRNVELTMRAPSGRIAQGIIKFTACNQRASLRSGALDSGSDVSNSFIRGQIQGCEKLGNDWWIRAVPMFGTIDQGYSIEGQIESSGNFMVVWPMDGVRHILIFGRGANPVHVFATNVTIGGDNVVPPVRLTSQCKDIGQAKTSTP